MYNMSVSHGAVAKYNVLFATAPSFVLLHFHPSQKKGFNLKRNNGIMKFAIETDKKHSELLKCIKCVLY